MQSWQGSERSRSTSATILRPAGDIIRMILTPGTLPTTRRLLLLAPSLVKNLPGVFQTVFFSITVVRGCTWNLLRRFNSQPGFHVRSWSFVGSMYEIFHINNFTFIPHGLVRTHKWPCPNVSGRIAQLVRASHRYREVTGTSSVEVLRFSGFYIRNCIDCFHICEDHSLLDFAPAVQYIKYFTYVTSQTIFCFTS